MKKLTKISKILLLVVAVLTMTQCRKAIEPVYQIPNYNGEKVLFTLTADNGSKGTRTEISQGGDTLNVTWSANDVIYVAGSEQGYLGSLTIQSGVGNDSATFSGEINAITSHQAIHVYYLGTTPRTISGNTTTIDISSQAGTLDDIENYHIASATITNVAAGTTSLTGVELETQLAIVNVDLTGFASNPKLYGTGVSSNLSLNLTTGELGGNTNTNYSSGISVGAHADSTYIALLPGSNVSMIFEYRPVEGVPTSAAFTNKDLVANTFYSFTDAGNGIVPPPVGVVDGLFSVGGGKQVYFSQGNLQFIAGNDEDATGRKWQFADEQWNALGNSSGNAVKMEDNREFQIDTIDLFGWGTSGGHTSNKYTDPWDYEAYPEESEYESIGYGYGPLDVDGLLVDLDVDSSDWGYNNIDVEGVITNGWRTLSKDEWNYLINGRDNASSKKGFATITNDSDEEKICLILLPDSFDGSITINDAYSYTDAQNLTDSGVVILPVTGYREVGPTVSEDTSCGGYWTSSAINGDNYGAHYFAFEHNSISGDMEIGVDVDCSVYPDPSLGLAVRLVKDY